MEIKPIRNEDDHEQVLRVPCLMSNPLIIEKIEISLRPARATDFDFLWELHRDALRDSISKIWGWDEAWQLNYFTERFNPGARQIIFYQGREAGGLGVEWQEDALYIAYIAIKSDCQGRGIGTAIIQMLIRHAREKGLPLTLTVLKGNPAKQLYERLGFVVTRQSDIRFWMAHP